MKHNKKGPGITEATDRKPTTEKIFNVPKDKTNFDENQTLDHLKVKCTVFKNVKSKTAKYMTPDEVFALIWESKLKNKIEKARDDLMTFGKQEYSAVKNTLPLIMFQGEFKGGHAAGNLSGYAYFTVIDLDYLPTDLMEKAKKDLKTDPFIFMFFSSVSGEGIKIVAKVAPVKKPDEHDALTIAFIAYLVAKYPYLEPYIDRKAIGISRGCFLSYDPEIFRNKESQVWNEKMAESPNKYDLAELDPAQFEGIERDQIIFQWLLKNVVEAENIEHLYNLPKEFNKNPAIKKIRAEGVNIFDFADGNRNNSLFYLATLCRDCGLDREPAEILLLDFIAETGLTKTEARATIRSAYKEGRRILLRIPTDTTDPRHGDISQKTRLIVDKLNEKGVVFDTIRKCGMLPGGKRVDDHFLNSVALECEAINDKIKTTDVLKVLESKFSTNFDPLNAYREKMEAMPPKVGPLAEMVSCIKHDHAPGYERLIEKWLGGIMGTICGSHSIMVLILVSKQQGIGKTQFFDNLLPDDLKHYKKFAKIDDSRDGLIAMTENLLIIDDEWAGMTQKEAGAFKRLVSNPEIKVRKMYGLADEEGRRIAIYAGTGNESEVIPHDDSGNRRIIVIRVEYIDIERYLQINKDEVFRELYERQKADPTWWHLTKEDIKLLNEDTQENTAIDPYQDAVYTYTAKDENEHVSFSEIEAHIKLYNRAYQPSTSKLSRALTAAYGSSVQKKKEGVNVRGYPLRLVYPGSEFKNFYELKQEALQ